MAAGFNAEMGAGMSRSFYDADQPAGMRFKHTGAEHGAPFDPRLHLARLVSMVNQPYAVEEGGDSLELVRAEIEAMVASDDSLRDLLR